MAPITAHAPLEAPEIQPTKVSSIKTLTESGGVASVPSKYTFIMNPNDQADSNDPDHSIPIIDFGLLTSGSPKQRSKVLQDLRKACEDWGFFVVINHGVAERVMKGILGACEDFFNLTEEEKKEFQGTTDPLDPIKCGTSSNIAIDKVLLWRDFVKFIAHPEFHAPNKPAGFSEVALEFTKRTRELATELLKAISETLGLESDYITKEMNWDQGLQRLAANYYPVCPEPDRAIGIPPHTDPGLVTFLIQNEIGGLQIEHKGKWVHLNAMPNAFVVNLGDQMQVLTNDKYKSVWHRAVVNNTTTRISIAVPHGPSLDTVIIPSPELLEKEGQSPVYSGMSYKDYLELKYSTKVHIKHGLDYLRISG